MRIIVIASHDIADGRGLKLHPGQSADIPEDLASAWLTMGYVSPGDAEPQRTAEVRAPRTADGRKPKRERAGTA